MYVYNYLLLNRKCRKLHSVNHPSNHVCTLQMYQEIKRWLILFITDWKSLKYIKIHEKLLWWISAPLWQCTCSNTLLLTACVQQIALSRIGVHTQVAFQFSQSILSSGVWICVLVFTEQYVFCVYASVGERMMLILSACLTRNTAHIPNGLDFCNLNKIIHCLPLILGLGDEVITHRYHQ